MPAVTTNRYSAATIRPRVVGEVSARGFVIWDPHTSPMTERFHPGALSRRETNPVRNLLPLSLYFSGTRARIGATLHAEPSANCLEPCVGAKGGKARLAIHGDERW